MTATSSLGSLRRTRAMKWYQAAWVAPLAERAWLQGVLVLVRHPLEDRRLHIGGPVDPELIGAGALPGGEGEVQRGGRALKEDPGVEAGLHHLGLGALADERGTAAIRLEAGRALG